MDVKVNDIIITKKEHPCKNNEFLVLRVGMDFKLRCQGCGHDVMVPRSKAEKNIRKVRDVFVKNGGTSLLAEMGGGKFWDDKTPYPREMIEIFAFYLKEQKE